MSHGNSVGALAPVDWIVIVGYFVVIFGIALWSYIRQRRDDTPAGYFLGGRNIGWFVVGASLFVSNIGSELLIGLSGTAADSGLAVGQFEILASLILLLLGWVFVPFYISSGVFTMPEFLERRYSKSTRHYLSVISIIGYVLTKISVTVYAGGIVFQSLMGIDFWTGALIVVIFTGVYTAFGGLRAVVYTDMAQMFVLLAGSVTVLIFGMIKIGGLEALTSTTPDGFMSVWQPADHPSFPWTGILLGAPIIGVWYWCTDQFIVQRTLAARDEQHARRGTIFGGYLKLLPLFIFVLPGVIAYVLVQQGEIELARSDEALPSLIAYLLPEGIRGIVVAGLLAALMSSLSSIFNSTSTLFTWDIYREWRPTASDRHLVWVGRAATVVLTAVGLAWVPFMAYISPRLYEYLQSVQAYLAPPIAAVFMIGIAWSRVNARGAIAALLVGFVIGATRLVVELIHGADGAALPDIPLLIRFAEFNFLHFAFGLFLVCVAVLIAVSLVTDPPEEERIAGLTLTTGAKAAESSTRAAETPKTVQRPSWKRTDIALTAGVILGVIGLWIWFA